MNNSSNSPPADPKPQSNNNEKNHPSKWPTSLKAIILTPPPMQYQQQNNWHCPPSMMHHPQQQFQHAPLRYFPQPLPIRLCQWKHQQYYPSQPNHHQQNENWSSHELRRLLDIQLEAIKELTREKKELEEQKSDIEGQFKEFGAKLESSENEAKKTKEKLEKKMVELDELLVRIEKEKGQKVEKTTETNPIDLIVDRRPPLTLSSPAELDPVADELAQLKNEMDNKNKLIKKMEAELEKANEEFGKLMEAQNGNQATMAKKKESLENLEEWMNAREKRFTEEKEFAIAQCRSEMDFQMTQIQLQLFAKDKEIAKLKGQNRQISKELDVAKSSRERLLRELQQLSDINNALEYRETNGKRLIEDLETTREQLLEEIYIGGEKLKKQANRCEQLNLELAAKNEEMEKMNDAMKLMENSLDAYKSGLEEKDEKIKKLEDEIVDKEEQLKAEEEVRNEEKERIKLMEQEIAKMKLEKEENVDNESKALANAKKYELKWTEANEEIEKMQNELAKMETLVRTVEKENEEKQKQLDKMEAEMEQAGGGGIGRGKRQQNKCGNESDSDYYHQQPGTKKKRMATQKNANPSQPIVNSISHCTLPTSSNLPPPSKKAAEKLKLCKTFGNVKMGASAKKQLKSTTT